MEFLWLPVILMSSALIFPLPYNMFLTVFLGLPGYCLFSYSWNKRISFVIDGIPYPYYSILLLCLFPLTAAALFAGVMNHGYTKAAAKAEEYEQFNNKINTINRDIMKKVYTLHDSAALEERKQISKRMHDTAGYVFTNLIMMLQTAGILFRKDPGKSESLIFDSRKYAQRGINEIRYILRDIRSESPSFMSIQNEIYNITRSFQKATGVEVTINYGPWPKSFGKTLDAFFISLVQESFTNALKHGAATLISIHCGIISENPTGAKNKIAGIDILDNGAGCDLPVKKGIGISSIEEYVHACNGTIIIRSSSGFHLSVSIPWDGAD
jgi:signal transduction histidine kinase